MSTVPIPASIHREPELLGQTVVVIGGSAGIGFETARRARAEGAHSDDVDQSIRFDADQIGAKRRKALSV